MPFKYWVGVAGRPSSIARLDAEPTTWWCVPREAQIGDELAMYCTASAAEERRGIFAIYEIRDFDSGKDLQCKEFGAFAGFQLDGRAARPCYAGMERKALFQIPLSVAAMRRDPILKEAAFLRRNFQGTFFAASPAQFARMKKLLVARNPKSTAVAEASGRGSINEPPKR